MQQMKKSHLTDIALVVLVHPSIVIIPILQHSPTYPDQYQLDITPLTLLLKHKDKIQNFVKIYCGFCSEILYTSISLNKI